MAGDAQSVTASVRSTSSTVKGKFATSFFSQTLPFFPFLAGMEYRPRTSLSFLGIFIVFMQFLGFVFNLRLRHGETMRSISNIIYAFQLPLFDDTFLGGKSGLAIIPITDTATLSSSPISSSISSSFQSATTISAAQYAPLFYIAAAIPILMTAFIVWFLLSGLPVRRQSWYFMFVKISLHAIASILFIPMQQSYLSMMVCRNEVTGSIQSYTRDDVEGRAVLWAFPQQECSGGLFWTSFVFGVIATIFLVGLSVMCVAFCYDSDPLTKAVKGRSSSRYDVLLVGVKFLSCLLFHIFLADTGKKHYFPMYITFAALLMVIGGALLVPYFNQDTLRYQNAGFLITAFAGLVVFLSHISTDNGIIESSVLTPTLGLYTAAEVAAAAAKMSSSNPNFAAVPSATTSPTYNADWVYSTTASLTGSGSSSGGLGPYSSPMTYSNSPYPFAVQYFMSMDLEALLFFTLFIPLYLFGKWTADVRVNGQLIASLPAFLDAKIRFIHPTILFPRNLPFRDLDVPLHRDICNDVADRAQEIFSDVLLQREMHGDGGVGGGGGGGSLYSGSGASGGGGVYYGGAGGGGHSDDDNDLRYAEMLRRNEQLFSAEYGDSDRIRRARGGAEGSEQTSATDDESRNNKRRIPKNRRQRRDETFDFTYHMEEAANLQAGGRGDAPYAKPYHYQNDDVLRRRRRRNGDYTAVANAEEGEEEDKPFRFTTDFHNNNDPTYHKTRRERQRRDNANRNQRPLLLTPFLTVIRMVTDIEASTRFLRVYYRLTGVFPNPHMLLLATRIYTKGMTRYRGGGPSGGGNSGNSGASNNAGGRLICNFAQFSASFVGKASLALSQLEKVQRMEVSLTTRYRVHKLQSALKSEINIREGAYQQQVEAAKKLHKETLMHIEVFWAKIASSSSTAASSSFGRGGGGSSASNPSRSSGGLYGGSGFIDLSHLATVASIISARRVAGKHAFLHALAHGSNDRLLLGKYADFVENVMFDGEGADHLRHLTEHEAEERKSKVMRGSAGGGGGGAGGGGSGGGALGTHIVFSQAITDVLTAHENATPDITITAVYQQRGLWAVVFLIIALLGGFLAFAFVTNDQRMTAIQCASDVGTVRALVTSGGLLALQHMLNVPIENSQERLTAIEDTVKDILSYHNKLVYGQDTSALGDSISDRNLINLRYVTPNVSTFSMSSLISIGYDPAHQLQAAVRLSTVVATDATTGSIIYEQREALKQTFLESYERWYPAALSRAAVMCDKRLAQVDESSIIVLTVLFVISLLLILSYAIIVALNAAHADQFRGSVLSLFPMIPNVVTRHLHAQAVERVQWYDKREEEEDERVEHLTLGSASAAGHSGGGGTHHHSGQGGGEGASSPNGGGGHDNGSGGSNDPISSAMSRRLSGSIIRSTLIVNSGGGGGGTADDDDDDSVDGDDGATANAPMFMGGLHTGGDGNGGPAAGGSPSSSSRRRKMSTASGNGNVGGGNNPSSSPTSGGTTTLYDGRVGKRRNDGGDDNGGAAIASERRSLLGNGGAGKKKRSQFISGSNASGSDDDDDASSDEDDEGSLFEKVAVSITVRQVMGFVFVTVVLIALFIMAVIAATMDANSLELINALKDAAAAVFPSFVVVRSIRFAVAHYIAFPVPTYAVEAQSYLEALFDQFSSVSSLTLPPEAVAVLLTVIKSGSKLLSESTDLINFFSKSASGTDTHFEQWNQTLSTSPQLSHKIKAAFTYDDTLLTNFRTLLSDLSSLCTILARDVDVNVTPQRVIAAVSIVLAVFFIFAAIFIIISLRNNKTLFFTPMFKCLFTVIVVSILVGLGADIGALVELQRFDHRTREMTQHIRYRYDAAIASSNTLVLARCFVVSGDELSFKYYEDAVADGDGIDIFLQLDPADDEIQQFLLTAAKRRAMEAIAFKLSLSLSSANAKRSNSSSSMGNVLWSPRQPIPDAEAIYGNTTWDFDSESDAKLYRQLHPFELTLYTTNVKDTRRTPQEQLFLASHLLFSARYKAVADQNANLMLSVYERKMKELTDAVNNAGVGTVIATAIGAGFKGFALILTIIGLAVGIQTYLTNLSRTNRAAASAADKGRSSAYSSVVAERNRRGTLLVRVSMAVMLLMFIVLYLVGYLNITNHTSSARIVDAGGARELIFAQSMIVAEKMNSGYISNVTAALRIDALLDELSEKRQYILTTGTTVSRDPRQMQFFYGSNVEIPAEIQCGFAPNGSISVANLMAAGSSTVVMFWRRMLQSLVTASTPAARNLVMNTLRSRVMPGLRAMRYSTSLLTDYVLSEVKNSHWAFVGITLGLIGLMIIMAIFVIRPLVAAYTEDVGGSKLLLRLIPQSVRDEIPAISEFMEMDLQEEFASYSSSSSGGGGSLFGGFWGSGRGGGGGGPNGGSGGKSSADSLIEPSNVPVIAIDASGIVLKYNAACEEVFGFTAAEVVGNNVSILMPDRIAAKHNFYLARYRVTGHRKMIGYERHVHARHQQGYLFPIELNIKEYRRSNGETVYFGFVRPIAKKLELRATDELNNLILEFAPLPMCAIDALGTVIRFNKAAEACFGHAAQDIIQQNVKLLMPEEYAVRHDSYLATYLRTHEKHIIDSTRRVTGLRKSGDVFPMDICVKEVKSKDTSMDDGMSTFLGYMRDVTNDIRLHHASLITDAVANLAPLPVIGINAVGKVLKFNTAASKLFGYEPNKVVGQNVKMLMPDHIATEHDRYLEEYASTGKKRLIGAERIMEGKKADGTIFPIKGLIREIKSSRNSGGGSVGAGGSRFGGGGSATGAAGGFDILDSGISTFIGYIVDLSGERQQNDLKVLGDAVVNSHPVAILTMDARGILTRVNRALCFEFGYNEKDILGRSVQTLLPFTVKPSAQDVNESILWLTQAVRRIQGRRKSGELLQLEVTLEEVTDVDFIHTGGNPNNNNNVNFGGNLGTRTSSNLNTIVGAAAVQGGNPLGIIGSDPRKGSTAAMITNNPTNRTAAMMMGSSLNNGDQSGNSNNNSNFDRAKSYVGYLRNITSEVALESRKAINIACLDISPVPIVVSDANGFIVQFSIAAQKLWKYSLDDVIGKNVSMLMPEHIRAHHDDFIRRYNNTGIKRMIDNTTVSEGLDRYGNSFPLEVSIKDITRPSKYDPFRQIAAQQSSGSPTAGGGRYRNSGGGNNFTASGRFGNSAGGGGGGAIGGADGFGSYPSPDSDEDDDPTHTGTISQMNGSRNTQAGGGGSIATQHDPSGNNNDYHNHHNRYFIAYLRNAARDGEAQEIIERNALISELSPVPLVQIDLYGTVLMFNKAAEEEFGYLRQEVLGKNVRILIPDDIAKHHDQFMATYRKTRVRRVIGSLTRTKAKRKSGELFAVELTVDEVIVEGDEDQNTYIAYIRNVTDEQLLTKANQLSGVVTDLSPTPLVAINSKGIVVNFNEAACRTFRYEARDVLHHNVKMLMPDSVAAVHDGYLTAYAKTGEKHIVDAIREVTAKRSDGTLFQVELAVREIKHPGQEESTFLSYIRDLTFNMQIAHTKRITDVVQSLSTVPMVIIDQQGIIQDVNRATPPMFGYMDEVELIGANVKILMTKDMADQHDHFIDKYLRTKVKHVIDTTRPVIALRKDGTTFTAELSVRELDVPEDFANMRGTRADSRALSTNTNSQYNYSSGSAHTHAHHNGNGMYGSGGVGAIYGSDGTNNGGGSSGTNVSVGGYSGGSSSAGTTSTNYGGGGGGGGRRKFFIAYLRNMDDLREMERNLNINTAITKGSAVPLIIIDKKGIVKQFVPAAEQFFGYAEADVIGKNVKLLMPEDIAHYHDAYLQEYNLTKAKKVVGTTRLVHAQKANGTIVPVSLTVREIPSRKVGETDFIGYIVDQSKEHAVEMALATTIAVRDMLPVAIISISDKGIVREFNKEAEKFFGYERSEVIGQNVNILMQQDVARVHDAYLEAYRRTLVRHIIGSTRSVIGKHKSGSELFIELQVSEFIVDQQRCFVGFANDRRDSMELEQSNRINNAMISLSIHPIITIDAHNNINHFNSAAEKQFGFSCEEVFGQNVKLLMPNEIAQLHDSYISEYKRTGIARALNQTRHVTAQRKNGDKFRAEITVKRIDHEGQMMFVAYCRDISKELEARSNAVFSSAISALMPDPFVAINAEGIVLVFSQAACQLFEYSPADVVGCNVSMLMPPEIAAEHNGYLKRYQQTREKRIIGKKRRVTAKTKSGKLIDVELHINEKLIEGKRFFFGYVRDCTHDFELALQTEIGEALVETNPDAIITIDTSGTITRFNATAEHLFQFDRHLVIGKNVNILMPALTAKRHDQYLLNYIRTGVKRIVDAQNPREVIAERKNGDTFNAYLSVRQLLDTEGHPSMFIGFIRPR